MKGMDWGAISGCVITWEAGYAEGAVLGGLVGLPSGAGKSMFDSDSQLIAADFQKRSDMKACAAIP